MSKKMLINATLSGEERVAIVEDGLLSELDIEVAGSENTKGNIYKAEVVRIEPGLQAAFVNYGAQRHGFLQIGDIHPDLWSKTEDDGNKQRPPINEILHRGQQLLVQVVKEERGTKGAAVTTELSLAGRYMVLMANSRSRGISRKIEKDSIRRKIKEILKDLDLPADMGYIIRTAAIDQPPEELKRDFNYLFSIYTSIISQAAQATAPTLIYQESSLVLRSVRDYFTPDMDEVLIDDREIFRQTREFFRTVMPDHVNLVKLHQERRPIFAKFQIEEQIAQLSNNTVPLPCGGSIVMDQTEALVAIDVNSGKVSSEQSIESTACLVNVEAATEIARQLRLRDLGGLVVIDFIDMRQRKNARKVEKTLEQALKPDKARITQGRISSQFGLLEMSRQRIKPNLDAASYKSCPHCGGSGRVRSCESRAISLLRRIQAGTAKGKIEQVIASVALDVGIMTLNQKRLELRELEQQYNLQIEIKPQPDYLPDQISIEFIKNSQNQQDASSEQKALVDVDFSERRRDTEAEDDQKVAQPDADETAPKDLEQSEPSQDDTAADPQAKPQRRSRSPRQRRPRSRRTTTGSTAAPQPVSEADQPKLNDSATAAQADVNASATTPAQAHTQVPVETQGKAPAEAEQHQPHTQSSDSETSGDKNTETSNTQTISAEAQATSTDSAETSQKNRPASRRSPARRSSTEAKSTSGRTRRTPARATSADAAEPEATPDKSEQGAPEAATQPKTTPAESGITPRQTAGRRPRKTAPDKSAPASTTQDTNQDQNAQALSQEPAPAPVSADSASVDSGAEAEKTSTGRKRTPRRTPARGKTQAAATSAASENSEQSIPDNSPAAGKDHDSSASEAESKPAPAKRASSGRAKKKTTDTSTTGTKAARNETAQAADKAGEEKAATKKPGTTRSRSRKTQDSTAGTSEASATKPARSTTRKATTRKRTPAQSETDASPDSPSSAASQEQTDTNTPAAQSKTAPAEKSAPEAGKTPTAKPRTRRSKSDAQKEGESAPATDDAPKTPRRKRTTTSSKSTAAKVAKSAPATPDASGADNAEAAEPTTKAKRSTRRTSTSRRTTSKKSAAPATATATAEEKPKRRRRSTASKTTASSKE